MIRVSGIKTAVRYEGDGLREHLTAAAAAKLNISKKSIKSLEIVRESVDARKKPVSFVYTVDVVTENEDRVLRRSRTKDVMPHERTGFHFPAPGRERLPHRPVIIGTGPAGLFCGLMLARAGYRPLLIERGERAADRKRTVDRFWEGAGLNPDSNVQFGEGGAGTFSDGKLNTLVKDSHGRGRLVLETFVRAGADEKILYENRPHVGTDALIRIVTNIRKEIEASGGAVRFETLLTDIDIQDGAVRGVRTKNTSGEEEYIDAEVLVAATGHSARDTFAMFKQRGVPMERKAFAVGVRIEHPQLLIDEYQYGPDFQKGLPHAAYKLTRKTGSGRGVYSFCMCPGGWVVDASTEEGGIAVNGMSYRLRDGENANSAMIVTVTPDDFEGDDVLSGVEFQRKLERAAHRAGDGHVPVQLFGDFVKRQQSRTLGGINPCIKGEWRFGDVRGIFPEELSGALEEGIKGCGRIIPGFDRDDAVLSGVESRTSSPVRILRDDMHESRIKGLYPAGEGAGYAGGITSAAMDGIKTAEMIVSRYNIPKS